MVSPQRPHRATAAEAQQMVADRGPLGSQDHGMRHVTWSITVRGREPNPT